jgi:dihydrofolate synthase/folylpolyglutamate synthase
VTPGSLRAASDPRDDAAIDVWLDALYARSRAGAPRDPERTRRLLARLALSAPPGIVHVVGTNGKGELAARVDAGLRAAGRRPLRFLSPHVERFHERVAVDGQPVRDEEIRDFLARAWQDEPDPPAAFFELAFALALDVARRRGADAAVIEAGVGAARDATATLPDARVVVVTNVAEDHLDQIGPSVRDVARDKGAAIRPGRPVVTGADGAPLEELARIAAERGAPLHVLAEDGPLFAWPEGADPPPGGVAEGSARLASATLRLFGLPPALEAAAVRAATRDPGLPARRERFVLADGRSVLLDAAHNPAAAVALWREAPPDAHVLLGVAARKDARGVRAAFASSPRLTLTSAFAGERPWGDDPAFVADPEAALAQALAALPPGGTLLVTGSFYLAGRLRPELRARADARPRTAGGANAPGYARRP